MMRARRERGAAAVEMALVLPLLLLVIGGLVDFGRAFYVQSVLSNAAREGARMIAMGYPSSPDMQTRVQNAVGGTKIAGLTYTATATQSCPNANGATVTVSIAKGSGAGQFHWLVLDVVPSLVGKKLPTPTLSATGNMKCNG